MNLITSSSDLQHLCETILPSCEVIFMDTEFSREKSFFPHLSLIQVAAKQDVFLIDALQVDDFSPLKAFFQNFAGEVVMFSARQDLETFHHRLGFLPIQVFDVQIALEVLGNPPSMGYATAVKTYLNLTLDKTNQYSDWLHRPLEKAQLQYAANDVIHLQELFFLVQGKIRPPFKKSWLREDMAFLTDPRTYFNDPDLSWQRLRLQSQDKRYLLRLKHLAAFRETQALDQDCPRSHILSDRMLQEMALKGRLPSSFVSPFRFTLEQLLEKVASMDVRQAPSIKPIPQPLPKDIVLLGRFVLEWLTRLYGVHVSYLATSSELDSLLRQQPIKRLKEGWRYHLFSRPFLDCLEGRAGLTLHKGKLEWLRAISPDSERP